METKYTKGEWECTKIHKTASGRLATEIITKDASIADVYGKSEEAQANAKLIAAAPDMLEILIKVKVALDISTEVDRKYWSKLIDKAITKATK